MLANHFYYDEEIALNYREAESKLRVFLQRAGVLAILAGTHVAAFTLGAWLF